MAENENRGLFGLHGITGMLIATVLLLSILAFLTVWSLNVQQTQAQHFYDLEGEESLVMNNPDPAKAQSVWVNKVDLAK
jgi:hypothetical protein